MLQVKGKEMIITRDGYIMMMQENGVELLRTKMTKEKGESFIVRSDKDISFLDYNDAMDLYRELSQTIKLDIRLL